MANLTKPDLRGLYAITPEHADGNRLLSAVEAALSGGCRIVQYRDKTSAMPECVARARALRELTRNLLHNAIRHSPRKDDGNLMAARAMLGPKRILGASCYADFAAAQTADAAGVDYVAFGAVYPSPTKPNAPLAGTDLFFAAKNRLTAASCAIGGITLDNAPPLIAAGADLLAVINDLFSAPDIAARATAYQRLFEEAQS